MQITPNSSVEAIADALEIIASCSKGQPISLTSAQEKIISLGGTAQQTTDAFTRLVKRSQSLGAKYPVNVTHEYLQVKVDLWTSPYLLMVGLSSNSLFRNLSSWSQESSAKLFEKVSEICLSNFFGEWTRSRNFGHPSDVGRPAEFDQAVMWIANLMKVPVGSGYRSPRRKDGGVDIFIWREFEDGFPGVPMLLVQCTIMENFHSKIGDVDTRLWASWLSSDIDPIVGLCVPQIVEKIQDWRLVTTRGLLFDRNRLSSMGNETLSLDTVSQGYLKELTKQFREFHL